MEAVLQPQIEVRPARKRASEIDYTVRIAVDEAERLRAAELVFSQYKRCGYVEELLSTLGPVHFALHHLLDEATIFIAESRGVIAGTLAVVLDSPAGLPMEDLYGSEIAALREAGRSPCELCALAVDPRAGRNGFALIARLFRRAYLYVLNLTSASDVCVTLKPSHAGFYNKLNFQPLGPFRSDARFNAAPTIALRLPNDWVRELWTSGEIDAAACATGKYLSAPPAAGELEEISREVESKTRDWHELRRWSASHGTFFAGCMPHEIDYWHQTLARKAMAPG